MRFGFAPSLSLPRFAGEGTQTIGVTRDPGDARNLLPLPRKRGRVGERALAAFFILIPLTTHAVTPAELLPDPAMEARARAITGELRCLVCQNQSIDDSDAPLAKDLRVLVREQLKAGKSDAEVKEFVHSRYGDFVLLRPPMRLGTLLLWLAPLLAMLAGSTFVIISARRRAAVAAAPATLTQEERARLKELGVRND